MEILYDQRHDRAELILKTLCLVLTQHREVRSAIWSHRRILSNIFLVDLNQQQGTTVYLASCFLEISGNRKFHNHKTLAIKLSYKANHNDSHEVSFSYEGPIIADFNYEFMEITRIPTLLISLKQRPLTKRLIYFVRVFHRRDVLQKK